MSAASDFAENEIADWLGANGAPGSVTNVYVQLHTGAPGEAGTSNVATETTRNEATFNAASGGVISLSATVSWTNVAATETISHVSLWDASTAGNCLVTAALTQSQDLSAGGDFDLETFDITVA